MSICFKVKFPGTVARAHARTLTAQGYNKSAFP